MEVLFKKLHIDAILPQKAHAGDAGLDLFAYQEIEIPVNEHRLVETGVAVALAPSYCGLVLSRSGLSAKHAVFVLNSPGLIDSGYRDEVKVILKNSGEKPFFVEKNSRIAQLVIMPYPEIKVKEVDQLSQSQDLRSGGFGSSGF